MYKIKNTELDFESRIFHLHKIFYSAFFSQHPLEMVLLHSHCFCLFSSFSMILHTLSTSFSEGIISGSIHVRKSLIIVYIPFT